MSVLKNNQWLLKKRPEGDIKADDFEYVQSEVPDLGEGEARVRTLYLSVDPTNRIWMTDMPQYMEPVQIGAVMRGVVIGVVEESKSPQLEVGDLIHGLWGWQEYAVVTPDQVGKVPKGVPVPLDAWMSVLGATGMTAYFGLRDIGKPKAGETIVISAAAGAVGSIAGQIAKIHGCRTVGIAGTDEKCAWLTDELGFDAAINYKTQDVDSALREACPNGIDIDFENVGGAIFDSVLSQINLHARIILCGLISSYNATKPVPGPYHFAQILMQRAKVEGFIITDYMSRFPEGIAEVGPWLASGKIKYRVDVVEGLEHTPEALNRLFTGANIGKQLVMVSEPPRS
ncbi:NADP-dependent oxidoreductase [Sulfidibacter corallicola]|uniref:NADP-dependent oxidoreductase n=1 Tax=Sulfidibacter corallicola TaxID=2818388 RepID=A0A8A4TPE1_SULCO|nr:NADP-dependent oxidoreductase [Sulfidibacter corallicola]QTD51074.1 NADP-dependent oxidoreductase [Sulfidibacter corallicola]